jgi:hypothetical protein
MLGEPAVAGVENSRDSGEFRRGIERPGPPDLPGEIYDSFGATVYIAVGRGDAHFPEQILGRQGEEGLHARVLQCGEGEAARFEDTAEAAGQRRADGAIAVEENPAARSMLSFRISYF